MIAHEAHFKVRVPGHWLAFDARGEVGLRLFCVCAEVVHGCNPGRLGCPSVFSSLPKPTPSMVGVFPLSSPYSCALPLHRSTFHPVSSFRMHALMQART